MYFAIIAAILVVIALILDFLFDGRKVDREDREDQEPPWWANDDWWD